MQAKPPHFGSTDAPRSTRDRRRRATSAAIERIALDLALEHGSDGTTVEMICERALISHRTFYNYFPSKEAAVLGPGPEPRAERLTAFRDATTPTVLDDLLDLLSATAFDGEHQERMFRDRQRLIRQEPELLARLAPVIDRHLEDLTDLTLERLRRSSAPTVDDPAGLRERAAMTVALAATIMRRSLQAQLEADDETDPRAVLDHSVRLARHILTEGQDR